MNFLKTSTVFMGLGVTLIFLMLGISELADAAPLVRCQSSALVKKPGAKQYVIDFWETALSPPGQRDDLLKSVGVTLWTVSNPSHESARPEHVRTEILPYKGKRESTFAKFVFTNPDAYSVETDFFQIEIESLKNKSGKNNRFIWLSTGGNTVSVENLTCQRF